MHDVAQGGACGQLWIARRCAFTLYTVQYLYMDASAMGKKGARITNKLLTPAKRSKAAKKGWKLRRERINRLSRGK